MLGGAGILFRLFEEKKNTRKTTNLLSIAFASKGNVF
jgi:hypothetical protein